MPMRLPLYQVDAFADAPFAGNPAAVVLLDGGAALPDGLRQQIAAEMNLSETSFVEPQPAEGEPASFAQCHHFRLRWNTPAREVPLCGHATFAAAAAIFQGEGNPAAALRFATVWSGELTVARADAGRLEMRLPLESCDAELPPFAAGPLAEAVLGEAVGLLEETRLCGRLQYLLLVLREGTTRAQLEALRPDARACLAAATREQLTLVIVTARGAPGSEHDFLSRCFAPWAGIEEDPVTGSAHSVLGPFWAKRLGRDSLRARQCSPRGGELGVALDRAGGAVRLLGDAVIVSKGHLIL